MVCPPTRRWRFHADRLVPDSLLQLLRWNSDFVRTMASGRFVHSRDYWDEVGRPVADALEAMATLCCTVRRDVTFRAFVRLTRSARYDVVFLIAHHLTGDGGVEFADGPCRFEHLRGATAGTTTLVLFVCDSADERDGFVAASNHAHAAGGAAWRLPFRPATLFLLYWLRELDGGRTLQEAMDRAVRTFTDRSDDEVPRV
jgi:hypothetical protein